MQFPSALWIGERVVVVAPGSGAINPGGNDGGTPSTDFQWQENGDFRLQENGDFLLQEVAP